MNRSHLAHSACLAGALFLAFSCGSEQAPSSRPAAPDAAPAAEAPAPPAMAPYTETIPGTEVSFDMVPVPGGTFMMGSPDTEPDRGDDEEPRRIVEIAPFWMGKCEVTWDEYELWSAEMDIVLTTDKSLAQRVDGVSRPTPAYTDMTFGMGTEGYPAICMTQHAAKTYCEWLSAATGHTYRLPTEAEWEYACRAGTTTAYSFGDDPALLPVHGWFAENSRDHYRPVGQKAANPWGLHDMHGNVAEWVLDQYAPYEPHRGHKPPTENPFVNPRVEPTTEYPRVARGGSWQDLASALRSAARRGSEPAWKDQDPQIPKSIWYHTDALFLGFRVVRPLTSATTKQNDNETLDPPEKNR